MADDGDSGHRVRERYLRQDGAGSKATTNQNGEARENHESAPWRGPVEKTAVRCYIAAMDLHAETLPSSLPLQRDDGAKLTPKASLLGATRTELAETLR